MQTETAGHRFIQQYEPGLPETPGELAQCIKDFVMYVIVSSGQDIETPPFDFAEVFEALGVEACFADLEALGIGGMNLAQRGIVACNDTDIQTRQRFTMAHEVMEILVDALRGNEYGSALRPYLGRDPEKKEQLCNWGAGLLLVPTPVLRTLVDEHGISLQTAEIISQTCSVSRLTSLFRLTQAYPYRLGMAVWHMARGWSDDRRRARERQIPVGGEISGAEYRHEPGQKLRAKWSTFGKPLRHKEIRARESAPEGSVMHEAWTNDEYRSGRNTVRFSRLDGTFCIEAVPYLANGERHVVSVFHWPESLELELNSQTALFGDSSAS
jgi:Zn-dependent peptidase ImmA (M78 family)